MINFSRRTVTAGLMALPSLAACRGQSPSDQDAIWTGEMQRLEAQRGGRIGIWGQDLTSGQIYAHRADERFGLCSTFKWMLGAVILHRVDQGEETLSRPININEADLVPYAPTTGPAVGRSLTVSELCAATIGNSDNPAANLLLRTLGGPEGFTAALRSFGDRTTRLDRFEPELNLFTPGDPRDTTTPRAMADIMAELLFGETLSAESRHTLRGWMLDSVTGAGRLKAGVPDGWALGHKTGTNTTTLSHDVGFALAPTTLREAGPVLIVSFTDGPEPMSAGSDSVHAEIAQAVFKALEY